MKLTKPPNQNHHQINHIHMVVILYLKFVYMLQDRRTPFSNVARSMLKTLVMTTGEFEFDTIFINDQELVDEDLSLFLPKLTGIFWVIFIIIMPIIFSNLLVIYVARNTLIMLWYIRTYLIVS